MPAANARFCAINAIAPYLQTLLATLTEVSEKAAQFIAATRVKIAE